MTKLGVKETKDLVISVAKFGTAAGKVLEDGKISIMEYPLFFAPVSSLSDALQGASQIPAELADLDNLEIEDLEKTFKDEFNIPEDAVEAVVDDAITLAGNIAAFILHFRKPTV